MLTAERPFRVLVIDDNRDGADTLVMLLRLSGYDVRSVYSGLNALVAPEDFAPDCIVSDTGR
jgi:CheY-like chemotaxis protein